MDIQALQYILESCKADVASLQDALFSNTLNMYNRVDSMQYISALNGLNIKELVRTLNAINVKRNMLSSMIFSNPRNIVRSQSMQDIPDSFDDQPQRQGHMLNHISSTNSLLFQIDDIL